MKLIALMPPLILIKSHFCVLLCLFCSVNCVNNDFILLINYSSYCIVLIIHFDKKSLEKYTYLNLTKKVTLQINVNTIDIINIMFLNMMVSF